MSNARNPEAPVKKIRVFDFDDTLARSNSNVLYEMPDGTTGKLNATQFAARAAELEDQGAEFDFSEFSKVVDGKKGPVFKAIENIVKASEVLKMYSYLRLALLMLLVLLRNSWMRLVLAYLLKTL